MEVLVTSDQMRACDRFAIEKLRIPGLILMENAGRGVVEMMQNHFGSPAGKSVIIFCGKGNNGGDGFVIARHLYNRGAEVSVVLLGISRALKGDARVNYEIIKNIAGKRGSNSMLRVYELKSTRKFSVLPKADFIIDAVFGTGFSGPVHGFYKDAINWINGSNGKKISVDIPSGVNADNGAVANVAVAADLTATMGLRKTGLTVGKGISCAGRVEVVEIGISSKDLIPSKKNTFLVGIEDVRIALPRRSIYAHKHSVGKIFVLAGSRGLTGAAAMAADSALRAGAGAVILGTPASVYPILAKKLTEVMVDPLSETPEGSLSLLCYDKTRDHLRWADLVIMGPGLSRNPETRELICRIVREFDKPLLIDADGLNALAEDNSILKRHRSKEVIITPHAGELSRLTGISSEEIELNRVEIARKTAKQFKLTLVLKGAPTVTASENGQSFINSTGNPGMATAGMGDVLAGIIGGLWAQGMERTGAAYSGVFVHGRAGDRAKEKFGEKSLMAMDVHQLIPDTLIEIENMNRS